jgi:hypothetical protein
MATVYMLPYQSFSVSAIKTLANGADANLLGIPSWSTNDSTLVGLTPTVDGLYCLIKSKGPTGTCTVTCTAQGTGPLSANITVTINASTTGLATALSLSIDGPPR